MGKILIGAPCLLRSWLVIPFLLFVGYTVAVARGVRQGSYELPHCHERRRLGCARGAGSLWGLLILAVQAALWSQYLHGGFRAGFNVRAIIRRLQFSLGLTVVVGALGIALSVMAVSGLIIVVIGVLLTAPYTSWVGAYIFGEFSRLTDDGVATAAFEAGRAGPVAGRGGT